MDARTRAADLRLAIFDVDGVFTDGRLYYTASGEELKIFNVRDGLGIKRLIGAGIDVAVISGRSSEAVSLRMRELGVREIFQGDHDKLPIYRALLERLALTPAQTAFMGDDLPDLPLLGLAGLAACPADAVPEVAAACHWQSGHRGGEGAVREFCDFVLRARSP
jgi:3-deoxy-D-manno-octulosonate 8-phosphate phosphatase (KDO 8-P phosphatase)